MKSFEHFLSESAASALDDRNKAINIEKLVKDKAAAWNENHASGLTDKDIADITEYVKKAKTFSLGKMSDTFNVSVGFLKSLIEAIKAAADQQGFSKSGGASKTQTQAGRIDAYLKQKPIGPIRR